MNIFRCHFDYLSKLAILDFVSFQSFSGFLEVAPLHDSLSTVDDGLSHIQGGKLLGVLTYAFGKELFGVPAGKFGVLLDVRFL